MQRDSPTHRDSPTPSNSRLSKAGNRALAESYWYEASAGTGKTHALTSRVLEILLNGAEPDTILCITHTRVAAAEMRIRIQSTLQRWVQASDAELDAELQQLLKLPDPPTERTRMRARHLLSQVLTNPYAFKFRTIHAYCQSLLTAFPMELGIPPSFRVGELTAADDTFMHSWQALLTLDRANTGLAAALNDLLHSLYRRPQSADDEPLQSFLRNDYIRLLALGEDARVSLDSIDAALTTFFDLQGHSFTTAQENILATCTEIRQAFPEDVPSADAFERLYPELKTLCLQKNGTSPRGRFAKKSLLHQSLVTSVLEYEASKNRQEAMTSSQNLFLVGRIWVQLFEQLRAQSHVLYFDNLIMLSQRLLGATDPVVMAPWVLFKLESRLRHILVDEAQDTSIGQWQIIRTLFTEVTSGGLDRRSLFIVGDPKQSIFAFQGADLEIYEEQLHQIKAEFSQRLEAPEALKIAQMKTSYRSAPAIMTFVNALFTKLWNETEPNSPFPEHASARGHELQGHVTLWPPVFGKKAEVAAQTAQRVCRTVLALNGQKRIFDKELKAMRLIEPRDIMILTARRADFQDEICAALDHAGIPFTSTHKRYLADIIEIQDLLAMLRWSALPEDRLSLAAFLQSAPVGIDRADPMQPTLSRWFVNARSWDEVQTRIAAQQPELISWLNQLRQFSGSVTQILRNILELPAYAQTQTIRETLIAAQPAISAPAINHLLELATEFCQDRVGDLDGFLHWIDRTHPELPSYVGKQFNVVRVLTIHAAKGDESPVVILPQCEAHSPPRAQVNWFQTQDQIEIPFVMPKSAFASQKQAAFAHTRNKQEAAESLRRLYVAVTRASQYLFLGSAFTSRQSADETSRFAAMKSAMHALSAQENSDKNWTFADPELRIPSSVSMPPPDPCASVFPAVTGRFRRTKLGGDIIDSSWKGGDIIDSPWLGGIVSPLSLEGNQATTYGTTMHILLENLPLVAKSQQHAYADTLIKNRHQKQNQTQHEALFLQAGKALALLETQAHADDVTYREMAISGTIRVAFNHEGLCEPFWLEKNARVDYVRINLVRKKITLVDYKTGQAGPTPPLDLRDPKDWIGQDEVRPYWNYLQQVAVYRSLLLSIYPQCEIEAQILWTSEPRIDVIPIPVMTLFCPAS